MTNLGDIRDFILAQPSAQERALREAKEGLDALVKEELTVLTDDNIADYCENITHRIVYKFLQQVEDEEFWLDVFNNLLIYGYQSYLSSSAA